MKIANLFSRQTKKREVGGKKDTNNHAMVENATPLQIFTKNIKKTKKQFINNFTPILKIRQN